MSGKAATERCFYCSRLVYPGGHPDVIVNPDSRRTRDHVIPSMMGAENLRPDNVVVACEGCNSIKADAPYEIFDFFIRNCKRGARGQMRLAMRQLVYNLARVGMITVLRDAAVNGRREYQPMFKPRGKYSLSDLRRGR